MSKTLSKISVAYMLKNLSEADDYLGKETVSDLDRRFARNRIRNVRDVIIEHAVDDVPVETAANEDI